MKVSEAIALAKYMLGKSNNSIIMDEIYRLLSHATGIDKHELFFNTQDISKVKFECFIESLNFRAKGIPISQIIGKRHFWKSEFLINNSVLDPRPETETVIEVALKKVKTPSKILDLGTGSSCLACSLALEYPLAKVFAIDKSFRAISLAKENAEKLNLRIDFINSDWANAINEKFDLIVCNPPYVSFNDYFSLSDGIQNHEPQEALMPLNSINCTGYESYYHLNRNLRHILTDDGYAIFEVGKNMASKVGEIFSRNGNFAVQTYKDLNNVERVISVINI